MGNVLCGFQFYSQSNSWIHSFTDGLSYHFLLTGRCFYLFPQTESLELECLDMRVLTGSEEVLNFQGVWIPGVACTVTSHLPNAFWCGKLNELGLSTPDYSPEMKKVSTLNEQVEKFIKHDKKWLEWQEEARTEDWCGGQKESSMLSYAASKSS